VTISITASAAATASSWRPSSSRVAAVEQCFSISVPPSLAAVSIASEASSARPAASASPRPTRVWT
jgi:hypothetical protein